MRAIKVRSIRVTASASLALGTGVDEAGETVTFALPKDQALLLRLELEEGGSPRIEVEEHQILSAAAEQ